MQNEIITREDISYLIQQSTDNLNIILSGMTALIADTNNKVTMLENQTWYQRMSKTIIGKNKMTQQEIVNNRERLNLYMSQAMTELFNQNCIDHEIMISLGNQMNEIYAEQVQLKQMLGAFVSKLNEKIVSIDNFHMLNTEIEQGVYSNYNSITAIFMVLSQLDARTLEDTRKMGIIERSLQSQNIISNEQESIYILFQKLLNISMAEIGRIYLELGTMRGNFIADMFLAIIESYYFLPDMARKIKNKNAIIQSVIKENQIDNDIELSVFDIYKELLNEKLNRSQNVIDIVRISIEEAEKKFLDYELDEAEEMLLTLAGQESGRAMYCLGLLYNEVPKLDIDKSRHYFKKGASVGDVLAKSRWLRINDNLMDEYDQCGNKLKKMKKHGDILAMYEYSQHIMYYSWNENAYINSVEAIEDYKEEYPNYYNEFCESIKMAADNGHWIALMDSYYFDDDWERNIEIVMQLEEKGNVRAQYELSIYFDILALKLQCDVIKGKNENVRKEIAAFLENRYDTTSYDEMDIREAEENQAACEKLSNVYLKKAVECDYPPALLKYAQHIYYTDENKTKARHMAKKAFELSWDDYIKEAAENFIDEVN